MFAVFYVFVAFKYWEKWRKWRKSGVFQEVSIIYIGYLLKKDYKTPLAPPEENQRIFKGFGMVTATKTRPHFTVAIDWKTRSLEQWLEQYGAWLLQDENYVSLGVKSQIGHLIDIANGYHRDRRKRALPRCNINDNEAMAIEGLLAHAMQTENAKIKKWMVILIDYYVNAYSEDQIAKFYDLTRFAVTRDKMLGLVRVATRFNIQSKLTD